MEISTKEQAVQEKIVAVAETLAGAKAAGTPINEAMTEFMMIDPLLHALGYQPWEIHKRGHDAVVGSFPDYTLLPGTPHKWFLEVKRLDLPLKDGEASQAVSYAHNQGARWAVLTNGRAWYIYDTFLQKPLAEKRVLQVDNLLEDPHAARTLALLSRASMMGGGLGRARQGRQVAMLVRQQMETPGSAVRKLLRKLAAEETKDAVSDALIGEALTALMSRAAESLLLPVTPPAVMLPDTDDAGPAAEDDPNALTLVQLAQDLSLPTGRKPVAVVFAKGKVVPAKSWKAVAEQTVAVLGASYGLPPLPYTGSESGGKYLLNTQPVRADGQKMYSYGSAPVAGQEIYIDTHRNAPDMVRALRLLLEAIGAPPDAVKVILKDADEPQKD